MRNGRSVGGRLAVMYEGEPHGVLMGITADGSNVMWQVQPGAFLLVARKERQKLETAFR